MTKNVQRRLAAILAADVAGYSRLMGADEAGTLAAMRTLRKDTIEPLVASHRGRIVKLMGDGLLVEFASVVDAVGCALAWQNERQAAEDQTLRFRIGVNLGDIIFEEGDIHGDGVNVAARLEGLAEPGGVCISSVVHDQVYRRIDVDFTGLGERELKNIDRPVRIWQWSPEGSRGNVEIKAEPGALAIPDKPSIAVLPFDNMSGDPDQEYFADGIAEDIITDLSKFPWLMVVARNSSFSFKGQATDLRDVAKELGVRYVLEGSVRKSGNRVRITAQLIDARDGSHIWAERYNRELEDIFDLQDEMTQSISAAIAPEIEHLEIRRALGERPENLDAWDYVQRAKSAGKSLNRESIAEALQLAERALELQPGYSDALAFVAMFYALNASMGWSGLLKEDAEKAKLAASEALKSDPSNINALCARGIAESMLSRLDPAVENLRQAVKINPNYSFTRRILARVLCYRGDYGEAVREAELALTLSPRDIYLPYTYYSLGFAHFAHGNSEEAAKWVDKVVQDYPRFSPAHLIVALAAAELGNRKEAKAAITRFLELAPDTTITSVLKTFPTQDDELVERYRNGLLEAGMPEE